MRYSNIMRLLVSTSDGYLQASSGAHCNIRFFCVFLVTSFREHDGGPHEESFWVVRAA